MKEKQVTKTNFRYMEENYMNETQVIVLQEIFSCLWQGNIENEILYVHSIDISTIKKKKKVYKTWENIHCTSDDGLKDSVDGKKVTQPWQMSLATKTPFV